MSNAAVVMLALALVLNACVHRSELERDVVDVSVVGWRAAQLPEIRASCYEGFAIRWAASPADFEGGCTGSTVKTTASCLSQQDVLGPGHARADYEPTAFLRPGQAIDAGGDPAVHEFMHLAIACTHLAPDVYDYAHTDHRVWAQWGPDAAQARARAAFIAKKK
jgi:hypothetical protein